MTERMTDMEVLLETRRILAERDYHLGDFCKTLFEVGGARWQLYTFVIPDGSLLPKTKENVLWMIDSAIASPKMLDQWVSNSIGSSSMIGHSIRGKT
jgi:hypothetical protein